MTATIDRINEREALAEQRRMSDERAEAAQFTKPLPFEVGTRLFEVQAAVWSGELIAHFVFGSEVHKRVLPNTPTSISFIQAHAAHATHVYGLAKGVQS